MKNII